MIRKRGNDILLKFIKGNITGTVKNEKLLRLYENFGLSYDQLLPVKKPPYVDQTPYKFHSTVNDNESYINMSRLSVTKLLTESWCELREYYTIFSGSLKEEKTQSLILGSQYHEALELEDFEIINIQEFEKLLLRAFGDDPVDIESELFGEWFENIVYKLYNLILKSDTREVLVHNYLDLNAGEFNLEDDSVLISGIIDYVKLEALNQHNYSLFEEIQAYVDMNHESLSLNEFFMAVANITESYKDQYGLKFADVKTRQYNKVPNQESVVKSAYLQISYYKSFFDTMSNDIETCFNMLCKNAATRHCDIDQPIDPKVVFSLLRKYPGLLLHDFKHLAAGKPIGFPDFDNHNPEVSFNLYDFTSAFTPEQVAELKELDNFEYDTILNSDILKPWSKPVTLRYLISRCAQFFSIFKPFNSFHSPNSNTVSIEYHNVKTNYNFKTLQYKYDPAALKYSIESATEFWNGERPPKLNQDLSKCKYCDFNSKCQIPNKNLKSFGTKLTTYLATD